MSIFSRRDCCKSIIVILLLSCIMICGCIQANACSSFAVYGDKTYYGMNWDYYAHYDATIQIQKVNEMKIFVVYDQDGNDFTGMNTKGLFASKIMEYPAEDFGLFHETGDNKLRRIEMKDVFRKALYNFSSIDEVNDYLKDKRIIYSQTKLHDMFADLNGHAQIVEVGRDQNIISSIEEKFLIMSNFTSYYYKGTPYREINDKGADRYISGYEYAIHNIGNFDLDNGLQMLEAMKCADNSFYTLGSFLFEPETNCVYIAVNRDFDKIWKVSVQDETIESYKGFEKPIKIKFDQKIKLSDLKKLSNNNEKSTEKLIMTAMVLSAAFASILFITGKNRKKINHMVFKS